MVAKCVQGVGQPTRWGSTWDTCGREMKLGRGVGWERNVHNRNSACERDPPVAEGAMPLQRSAARRPSASRTKITAVAKRRAWFLKECVRPWRWRPFCAGPHPTACSPAQRRRIGSFATDESESRKARCPRFPPSPARSRPRRADLCCHRMSSRPQEEKPQVAPRWAAPTARAMAPAMDERGASAAVRSKGTPGGLR